MEQALYSECNKLATERQLYFGKNRYGQRLTWEFCGGDTYNRNLLITGTTGCGKTVSMRNVVGQAIEAGDIPMLIFDHCDSFLFSKFHLDINTQLRLRDREVYSQGLGIPLFEKKLLLFNNVEKWEDSEHMSERISDWMRELFALGPMQKVWLQRAICLAAEIETVDTSWQLICATLQVLMKKERVSAIQTVYDKCSPMNHFFGVNDKEQIDWSEFITHNLVYRLNLANLSSANRNHALELTLRDLWMYLRQFPYKMKPFIIVIDECQLYTFQNKTVLKEFFAEGRKYGVSLWLATQTMQSSFPDVIKDLMAQAAIQLYFIPPSTEQDYIARKVLKLESNFPKLKRGECLIRGSYQPQLKGSKAEILKTDMLYE